MVNAGPSEGCNTCKRRKVRCDQARPACSTCSRLAIECTGYGKKKRTIKFKDQTEYTAQQSQNHGARRRSKNVNEVASSHTESSSLLQPLDQPIALYAISFFFNNFVNIGRSLESTRGFVENILPIYSNAPQTSPIALAVSAVSISVFSLCNKDYETHDIAAKHLSAALHSLRDSLNDPLGSKCDGNIMASILLQFHETLHAVVELRAAIPVHQNGAMSLIKCRGIQNFQHDTAKYLLLYVRSAEVCCAIREGRFVDAELLAYLGRCNNLPSNPSLKLDKIGVHVANIQAEFIELGQESPEERQMNTHLLLMGNLKQRASDLERELLRWSQALPEHWLPLKLKPTTPIPMYENICEIYPSIHTASIWNTWRCYRLVVNKIILAYGHTQNPITELKSSRRPFDIETSECFNHVQAIVDSICYSVPFHLGNRIPEQRVLDIFDSRFEFPGYFALEPEEMPRREIFQHFTLMPRDEHIRHALAQGAWHIAGQLGQLVSLLSGESGRLLVSALRPGQVAWIQRQLLRVSTLLCLPQGNTNFSNISPLCIYTESEEDEISARAKLLAKHFKEGFKFTGI